MNSNSFEFHPKPTKSEPNEFAMDNELYDIRRYPVKPTTNDYDPYTHIKPYDYIIVGAGPTSLTLAYCLGYIGKRCLVVEKCDAVGGSHRVTRVNGIFTEHSCRIYSTSYINTFSLLNHMKIKPEDIFTKYNFTISNIGTKSVSSLKPNELMLFTYEFIKLFFGDDNSKNISIKQFMINNNFEKSSMSYVDRLCRLTDGATSEKYSVYKFLQLINQQGLETIYQPKLPNDKLLFPLWLSNLKNVKILLNTEVIKINEKDGIVDNLILLDKTDNLKYAVTASKYLFAIPPKPLYHLFQVSSIRLFNGMMPNFKQWVEYNSYIDYIPIIYHWNKKIDLSHVWGFPASEWGVGFIVLSDYMSFNDGKSSSKLRWNSLTKDGSKLAESDLPDINSQVNVDDFVLTFPYNQPSKTVISSVITIINTKSSVTGKTANESTKEELIKETLRQLRIVYPNLPKYQSAFIHDTVIREDNKWVNLDKPFVSTDQNSYVDFRHPIVHNLYTVGTHNGRSEYAFTSFESDVTNALYLVHELEPKTKNIFKIKKRYTLIDYLRIGTVILLIVIFYYIYKKKNVVFKYYG
jgi:hypothetical protein